jgi:hypothetical protein
MIQVTVKKDFLLVFPSVVSVYKNEQQQRTTTAQRMNNTILKAQLLQRRHIVTGVVFEDQAKVTGKYCAEIKAVKAIAFSQVNNFF